MPANTMRAGVDVDFGRVSARVSGRYVQGRKDNDFNAPGFPIVDYDNFTVVDASVTYRLARQHALVLAVNNLFDAFYYEKLGYPLQGASFKAFVPCGVLTCRAASADIPFADMPHGPRPGRGRQREGHRIMRSISTMRGDGGETSLAGGVRVSKGSLRVETYGTVDELNSIARVRAIDLRGRRDRGVHEGRPAGSLQDRLVARDAGRESEAADRDRPRARRSPDRRGASARSDRRHARRLVDSRRTPGGRRLRRRAHDLPASRAVARAASGIRCAPCSRRFSSYVNRLSDLLWLFGRKLEHDAGVSGSLRDVTGKAGNRFSRAW